MLVDRTNKSRHHSRHLKLRNANGKKTYMGEETTDGQNKEQTGEQLAERDPREGHAPDGVISLWNIYT